MWFEKTSSGASRERRFLTLSQGRDDFFFDEKDNECLVVFPWFEQYALLLEQRVRRPSPFLIAPLFVDSPGATALTVNGCKHRPVLLSVFATSRSSI
jgi:hypothetical protein